MQSTTAAPTTSSSSSRRTQQPKPPRTTASRKSGGPQTYARGLPSPDSTFAAHLSSAAKFYPGLAAFTDAIDALPRETIRHFTLLREVDAKACGPEKQLRDFIESASSTEAPPDPTGYDRALEQLLVMERLKRCQEDMNVIGQAQPELLRMSENMAPPSRRSRMQQIRWVISDLLLTLDEKIHVISTAADALNKQLNRIDDAYCVASKEVDVISRDGNPDHWAYETPVATRATLQAAQSHPQHPQFAAAFHPQPHVPQHGHIQQQHAQRQGHHNPQGYLAGEGVPHPRSESKKESAKRMPAYHAKSHDDDETMVPVPTAGTTKKSSGSKSKKEKDSDAHSAAHAAALHGLVGASKSPSLGATVPGVSNKRRKLTAQANSYLSNGNSASGNITPRDQSPSALSTTAPVPAAARKKASGQTAERKDAAKRKALGLTSPKTVAPGSSKVPEDPSAPGHHPPQKHAGAPAAGHGGGPPNPTNRPASAPRNKTKAQPSSKEDTKGPKSEPTAARAVAVTTIAEPNAAILGAGHEHTATKEPPAPESADTSARPAGSKKSAPREDKVAKAAVPAEPLVTKVEEKPPLEALAPTAAASNASKAPSISKAAAAAAAAAVAAAEPMKVEEEEEDEEIEGDEADEMRYCYCNQVSYGRMVACDGPDCKREWFHLPCVGLSHMPGPKEKWYCNDCRTVKQHSRSHSRY